MIDFENKKKLSIAITVYCSLVLFIIFIAKYEAVLSVFSSLLSVLSPILIGFALAYFLNPILKFYELKVLKRIKNKMVSRGVAMLLTYISIALFITGFVLLIIPQLIDSITTLSQKFDVYKNATLNAVDSVIAWLQTIGVSTEKFDSQTVVDFISSKFGSADGIIKNIVSYLAQNIQNLIVIPKNILLAFFISIYVLLSKERLGAQARKGAKALMKEGSFKRLSKRLKMAHETFGGYFTGVVIDAIFVGILTFIVLLIFDIPYASLVSVVVAITNVIPIFGPFLGAIPSALLIFIESPQKAILFAVLILIIQQVEGNILAPMILGDSTGMSSLGVIVAITVMGACFGFVGMFVGVPVFAVLIALLSEIVEEKLRAKGFATDTADYYPRNSFAKPKKEHKTLAEKLFGAIKALFNKIFKKKEKTQQ